MYYPSRAAARQLRQKDFLVPLKKEINLNLSPQEAYRRIRSSAKAGAFSFLLESCRIHPKTGRFSFVGSEPFLIFKNKGNSGEPIEALRSLLGGYRSIKVA